MKPILHPWFLVLAWLARIHSASAQPVTLLHSFGGAEGANPHGSLILSNATLYGMTSGSVFKMNVNGSGCTNLHIFSSYGGNGKSPYAALTLSGSTLYGMTVEGGVGRGVVFRLNTDGTGYTNLHKFVGGPGDGSMPYGSLTLADGRLHGMAMRGGASDLGTLFRIDTDGTGYTHLHVFAGGPGDGAYPMGDLLPSGTNFYGLTTQGGTMNLGTIFRVNTDGTGYTNLHSFAGYPSDGAGPPGSLALEGATLYGMTQAGGADTHKVGAVFKMDTDGSGYRLLHSFAGRPGDGATPLGSLTLADGRLYGMTSAGGASNYGAVFRLNTDGSGYTNLHSFTVSAGDGATAYGSLVREGSTLYGMTFYGGSGNKGVAFSLPIVSPELPTSLAIRYGNSEQAVVSWPASASGWTLQTNTGLAPGTWGDYLGRIVGNSVTNSPTNGSLFYRLRHP